MEEITLQVKESATQDSVVLRTEGLIKRYGKRTVVNDVSFNVRQGEIVGLLGPNGAGKTTSFYMTTGLIVPNGGHIYLGNEDVTKYPVYRRARAGIGYLAQEPSVFRKMSVEDNILSVLEMTGKPRDYQLEKLESLIREFRLDNAEEYAVKDEIKAEIESRFGYDLSFTLDSIRDSYSFDVSCMGTVPPAIVAFLESEDFIDAIRNAISIGGDSDTLAACTGAIAEAYYGIPVMTRNFAETYLDARLDDILTQFELAFPGKTV